MDPLVDLVDRQAGFLVRQADSQAFLIQVEPFLSALQSQPQLAVYLDDILEEVAEIVGVMEEEDAHLSSELMGLRRELVELRPEADDSRAGARKAAPTSAAELAQHHATLAFFDEVGEAGASPFNADGEGGRAKTLLSILQRKDAAYLLEAEPGEAEPAALGQWRRRLWNLQRRYDHALRRMTLRVKTSAGLALLKLDAASEALNPPVRPLDGDGDSSRSASAGAASDGIRSVQPEDRSLFKAVWREQLDASDHAIIDRRVAELRDSVERLREDLHRRIGTTRSRLALVDRFKLRSEWHDRERLVAIAERDGPPGAADDRLTAELARYLFDGGLSPLTREIAEGPQTGYLLDPAATFYVEARQYGTGSSRGDVVATVAQVLDNVGRIRNGPYPVDEAVCAIFRRGGRYYDLPAVVQTRTYRLHLVVVDLAPTHGAGSARGVGPVQIDAAEFLAAATSG
jgi:hypothetical protein